MAHSLAAATDRAAQPPSHAVCSLASSLPQNDYRYVDQWPLIDVYQRCPVSNYPGLAPNPLPVRGSEVPGCPHDAPTPPAAFWP